jgi:hypothetical protein
VLYVQRSRINERPVPAGFIPVSDVIERLGMSPGWLDEARRLARSTWTTVEAGPHKKLFVDVDSVGRWLRSEIAAGRLLTADEAERRLGAGRYRLNALVMDGRTKPKMTVTDLLGSRGRVRLYDPVQIDRLVKAHTPPDGWITLAEAARRSGATLGAMRGRADRGKWHMVIDLAGMRWVNPAVAVASRADVTGMLRIPELLERAGIPVTATLVNRVKRLAQDWPGAVRAAAPGTRGTAWWFPNDPQLIEQLPERLKSGRAGYERLAVGMAAYHAKIRQLNQEASEVAPTSDEDGDEGPNAATG